MKESLADTSDIMITNAISYEQNTQKYHNSKNAFYQVKNKTDFLNTLNDISHNFQVDSLRSNQISSTCNYDLREPKFVNSDFKNSRREYESSINI